MRRIGYVLVGVFLVSATLLAGRALADDRCDDVAKTKQKVAAYGGKWAELTRDQWQFLRGISVVEPYTAEGLPFGDKAVLVTGGTNHVSIVLFLDGNRACDIMIVPDKLVGILNEIKSGTVKHEGSL